MINVPILQKFGLKLIQHSFTIWNIKNIFVQKYLLLIKFKNDFHQSYNRNAINILHMWLVESLRAKSRVDTEHLFSLKFPEPFCLTCRVEDTKLHTLKPTSSQPYLNKKQSMTDFSGSHLAWANWELFNRRLFTTRAELRDFKTIWNSRRPKKNNSRKNRTTSTCKTWRQSATNLRRTFSQLLWPKHIFVCMLSTVCCGRKKIVGWPVVGLRESKCLPWGFLQSFCSINKIIIHYISINKVTDWINNKNTWFG